MSPFQLSKFLSPTGHGLLDFNFAIIFIPLINFAKWERALERKGFQVSGRSQGVEGGISSGCGSFFLL